MAYLSSSCLRCGAQATGSEELVRGFGAPLLALLRFAAAKGALRYLEPTIGILPKLVEPINPVLGLRCDYFTKGLGPWP
jgi:hypothetical protein